MDNAQPEPTSNRAPLIGIVILAAGGSTRMGQPKQLLLWKGAPLITHAVSAALAAAPAWPVVVVLGNASAQIRPVLAKLPLLFVENPLWERGLGSSIRLGVQTLERFSLSLEGAIITLADQPRLTADALRQLVEAFAQDQTKIVAAQYAGALGSPVLFPRSYFPELLALPPDVGAQRILKANLQNVIPVDLPELAVDLDTPEDYQNFIAASGTE